MLNLIEMDPLNKYLKYRFVKTDNLYDYINI